MAEKEQCSQHGIMTSVNSFYGYVRLSTILISPDHPIANGGVSSCLIALRLDSDLEWISESCYCMAVRSPKPLDC